MIRYTVIYRFNGTQHWYQNGQLHRENNPAIICSNGIQFWYQNGKRHREDGPAVIYACGTKNWCLNNIVITSSNL
jgi:hypothetical protein